MLNEWTISLICTFLLLASQVKGQCNEGDVRLEGGSVESEGRVYVCVDGVWGRVCDDDFEAVDRSVVCQQLGYSRFNSRKINYISWGDGLFVMDDVACSGDELRLIDCAHTSDHDCLYFESVRIKCDETVRCVEGDIRLADGNSSRGRVEACIQEQWSSLCGTTWTAPNTKVVCQQLGYHSSGIGKITTIPADSAVMIYQQQFECTGDEMRLVDCDRASSSSPSVCTHNDDLTIQCHYIEFCYEGDVRLAGGTEMRGRVEVCVGAEWGTVCDDFWDHVDARVVCRQLGFSGVTSTAPAGLSHNTGSGPIHMDNVICTGLETTLLSCTHTEDHNCYHIEDAQVNCQPRVCDNGDVGLVSSTGVMGEGVTRGRVEICWNETWGTVCDHNWDALDARVVCRELGFSQFGTSNFSNGYFGQGTGPIYLRSVACDGTERTMLECAHDPIGEIDACTHADDAGVSCRNLICVDGDLRLMDGLSQYEGRLEICFNEMWGTVCDDYWSRSKVTEVTCRQLGFMSAPFHGMQLESGLFPVSSEPTLPPILLDDVSCLGSEDSILHCHHRLIGEHNCRHHEDVNLRCGQCSEYDVRLVDGDKENEGRVEVCVSGRWGTVCDDNWDNVDAKVVCRQLGLLSTGSQAKNGRYFPPNPSLPIVMDRVICNGEEECLGDCNYLSSNALRNCTHNEDAGVRCLLGPPVMLVEVAVMNVSERTVQLSWSPPVSSNNHSSVTGFTISCASDRAPTVSSQIQGNQTLSSTLTGLQPYTNYTCCVSANSAVGAGPSKCTTAHTLTDAPEGPPLSIVGFPTSSRSISLSWQPPSMPNGRIVEYHISVTEQNTSAEWLLTSQYQQRRISELHAHYIYSVRVAAFTIAEGPYSSSVMIQTYQDVPSAAPTNLTPFAITNTSISLQWGLPDKSQWNGILIHHSLNIRKRLSGDKTVVTIPMPALQHTVLGLQPHTTYDFEVAAATVNGTGPYTPTLSLRTNQSAPLGPPLSISHSIVDTTTVSLRWSPPAQPNGIISHYILAWEDTLSGRTTSTLHAAPRHTVLNLHPDYAYRYQLAAYTVDLGPYSHWKTVRMPEDRPSGPPQSFRVTDVQQTNATLSWLPPRSEERNGVIRTYKVVVTDSSNAVTVIETSSLSVTVSSLLPNSEYRITVTASTSVGFGPSTEPIIVATRSPSISGPPRNVSVAVIDHQQLNVTWEPPPLIELNGEIDAYMIRLTEVTTNIVDLVMVEDVLFTTLTELHPNYQYTVEIAVETEAGFGQYSAVVSAATLPYVPSESPAILSTNVTRNSVSLAWSAVPVHQQNGDIISYRIIAYIGGTANGGRDTLGFEVPPSEHRFTFDARPFTEYILGVAAVNLVGQGPLSDTVMVRTEEDDPTHEPRNLSGEAISSTSIYIQWDPPPSEHHNGVIDSYTVLCSETDTERILSSHTTPTTSIAIRNLHPFYTYECNVSAVTVGHGPFSETIAVTTWEDEPGPPTNLQVVDVGSRHVEISWSEPVPSQQNGILRYYIIYVTPPNHYFSPLIYSITLSFTVTTQNIAGLNPYTAYHIAVAAVTIGPGKNATLDTQTLEAPPSASPYNITVVSISSQTLTVSWEDPPSNTNNGILRYYTIRLLEQATGLLRTLNRTSTPVTVEFLHPYYVYEVRVAIVTIGVGKLSPPHSIRMPEAAPSSAPTNLSVSAVGVSHVLLRWFPPPQEDHNGVIKHYEINLQAKSHQGTGLNSILSTMASVYIDNLQSNTEYSCSVAAVTVAIGPASKTVNFTTDTEPLGSVQGLTAEAQTPKSITISWQPPVEANGPVNYTVVITLLEFTDSREISTVMTTDTSVTIESLRPNYLYQCSVSSSNGDSIGPSASVLERTLQDVPSGPPTNIRAQSLSPRTLHLSWLPPVREEQNGDILQYGINITDTLNGEDTYDVVSDSSLTVTLHPYYVYNYSISAINSVGRGPFSSPENIQMPPDIPSYPPLRLMATNSGPGSVVLSWQPPPTEHHNGLIIGYIIHIIHVKSSQTITLNTNETSITRDKLRQNQAYNFTVAARTNVGQGPLAYTAVTTLSDGKPPVPTLGQVERTSPSQIRVIWNPSLQTNTGGPITNYTVKYYPLDPDSPRTRKSVEDLYRFLTTVETELVISDLDPVLSYSVSVAANNAAGRGNFSNKVTVGLFENCNFQLFLTGHIICQEWVMFHIDTKLQSLSLALSAELEKICSCNFSPKLIRFNQPHCITTHADWLILSGIIISTEISSCTHIIELMQVWVQDESELVVEGVHLKALKQCSVYLEDEGKPIVCGDITQVGNNSSSPSVSTDSPSSSSPVAIHVYTIIAVVILLLVLLIVVVVCITTVKVLRKKAHYRLTQHPPPSAYNMQIVHGKGQIDDKDIYDDCTGGEVIYETILDPQSPPFPPTMPPLPPIHLSVPNPYDIKPETGSKSESSSRLSAADYADEYITHETNTDSEQGEQQANQGNSKAVPSIDFDKEPPYEYHVLEHGGQMATRHGTRAAASGAGSSSHYQPLMVVSETKSVYTDPQKVIKPKPKDKKDSPTNDDPGTIQTESCGNGYQELLIATKEKKGEYANLVIQL